MEFPSKLPEPLSAWLRLLTTHRRLASILCASLVVAGVVMVAAGRKDRAFEPLLDGRTLSVRQIARMTAAFRKAGLLESRVIGNQIHVPRTDKGAYLVALAEADALPPEFDDSPDAALLKHNPLATRRQIEMDYKRAEQQKLARIVSGLHGIDSATVQYDETRKPGFPPVTEKWAIVAVRAADRRPLEYEQIEAIRDTVAGYIAGLDRKNVTVTDMNACRAYPGTSHGAGPEGAGYACAAKRMFEREYRSKIEQRLAMYQGAVVGVNVHLASTAPVESPTPSTGGQAACASLVPALVTASIDLPKSYFRTVWRERNPDAASANPDPAVLSQIEQEIKRKVERAVLALLPPPAPPWDSAPQVVVTSYDDGPAAGPATLSVWSETSGWPWRYGIALLAALALAGTAVVAWKRLGHASHLGVATQPKPATAKRPGGSDHHPETSSIGARQTGIDWGEQLSRLVQEHPDAAARVLKAWLYDKAA